MTWWLVLCLAVGTYALKAAGPLLLGDRVLPPLANRILGLVPAALLAALVAVQTVQSDRGLVLDARAAGLAVAAAAVLVRAPFVVVVAAAMIATALLR